MKKVADEFKKKTNTFMVDKLLIDIDNDLDFRHHCRNNNIELTTNKVLNNLSSVINYKQNYLLCNDCRGLDFCEQDAKGYRLKLIDDGIDLNIVNVPCKYLKEFLYNRKVANNIQSFFVPKKVLEANIDEISFDDKSRIPAIREVLNYIQIFKKGVTAKGLYMHGNFGVGKTFLAGAIANKLAEKHVKVGFIYFPDMVRELKSAINEGTLEKRIDEIKNIEVVIFDDFGSETVTPFARDELIGPILQYRYMQGLPTIITSNLNFEQLENHLKNTPNGTLKATRLVHRLKGMTHEVVVTGRNNRF